MIQIKFSINIRGIKDATILQKTRVIIRLDTIIYEYPGEREVEVGMGENGVWRVIVKVEWEVLGNWGC